MRCLRFPGPRAPGCVAPSLTRHLPRAPSSHVCEAAFAAGCRHEVAVDPMGWGKAKHSSAIAAGEGCTALLCGFRTLGVAYPCLQEAGRVCVTGGDAAPWGLSAAAACTSYQCRGRETSCSPCLMLMWANQPGEASAWSQHHPATNWSSVCSPHCGKAAGLCPFPCSGLGTSTGEAVPSTALLRKPDQRATGGPGHPSGL